MSENLLEEKIMALKRNGAPFPPDAYRFVHQVVVETVQSLDRVRHVTAVEVLEHFRLAVERDFGVWSTPVLEEWELNTPAAVGRVVFDLVEIGALSANANDSILDFDLPGITLSSGVQPGAGAPETAGKWKGEWID